MRALSGFALCACAALATAFSPAQQASPARLSGPTSNLASSPAAPKPPQAVGIISGPATPFYSRSMGNNQGQNLFYRPGTNKAESRVTRKISDLKRQLGSDDAKIQASAEEELKDAVSVLFDLRTDSRKKQIEDLEKRLAKLRQQLEKREDNKSEIVRLHVQTMLNEAKGLGF